VPFGPSADLNYGVPSTRRLAKNRIWPGHGNRFLCPAGPCLPGLDSRSQAGLECLTVRENRHRWKTWITDRRVRQVLEEGAKGLQWAWRLDRKSPKRFPVNTWYLFIQIDEQLRNAPVARTGIKIPPPPPPPEELSDLLKERTIKAAYQDQHDGSYEDALKQAARGQDEGYLAWRKIMRALDLAYVIIYQGLDFAPAPRVHFLHRKLLEVADSEHLCDLNFEGIAEFFDDVCPCGKKHQPDAIRKLRKRRGKLAIKSAETS
jgi:hypothetical protein